LKAGHWKYIFNKTGIIILKITCKLMKIRYSQTHWALGDGELFSLG